jgi:flavin-dependent dehydrogenase
MGFEVRSDCCRGRTCRVNGGPTAASARLKVALLEKRQEIGSPVRCAGGVSRSRLCELVKPDPSWIAAEVGEKQTSEYAYRDRDLLPA